MGLRRRAAVRCGTMEGGECCLSQLPGVANRKEKKMAKTGGDGIYKIVEVIGTSSPSWEDAAKKAVETASKSLRDLRVAEVVKQDMTIENGKVAAFRTRVLLSFKYQH